MEPDNYAAVVQGGGKALNRQGKCSQRSQRTQSAPQELGRLQMQGESAPPGRLRLRAELNQAQIQLTFTENTTCPAAAGLSEPVSVHCNPP